MARCRRLICLVSQVAKADEFLLLACDGFWDVVDAIDAVRIMRSLLFEKGFSARESADRLVELAANLAQRITLP